VHNRRLRCLPPCFLSYSNEMPTGLVFGGVEARTDLTQRSLSDCPSLPIPKGVLGPTRPDRLTIWPVETGQFGIDVRWGGGEGNTRATVVRRLLTEAG
jgi:hypothetical protein